MQLCMNDGTCSPLVEEGLPSFECDCVIPHAGELCEDIDRCLLEPCENNGTCVTDNSVDIGYECACEDPYISTNCTVLNSCLVQQPCLNGGTCDNIILDEAMEMSTFTCSCPANYTGRFCEQLLTSCYPSPCQNSGVCMLDSSLASGYFCSCPLGFVGVNCSDSESFSLLLSRISIM